MYFLINNEKKIVFGWSAKCGCSHVKKIWWYLNDINKKDVHICTYNKLPININNYTTIIFSRNPYKRIVSGFLDKYNDKGTARNKWKHPTITFSSFVNEVINENWEIIDKHHFTPQTSEAFKESIFLSKKLTFYDISSINYEYIEELFNKKIPEEIIKWKGTHTREQAVDKKHNNTYVYNINMSEYFTSNVDTKYFYNEEIKNKIFNFYKNDFEFFNNNGIDYTNFIIN